MLKMAVPGLVRALAVTPDSVYCTGAIAEKIYIWQVDKDSSLPHTTPTYCTGIDRPPVGGGGGTLSACVCPPVH